MAPLKLLILMTCVGLFLVGCTINKSYDVKFQTEEIEMGQDMNECQPIKSINDIEINETMKVENEYRLSEKIKLKCNTINTMKLGDFMYSYSINGINYSKKMEVVDTEKPVIDIKQSEYEVQLGNEYFNVDQLFTVTDNSGKYSIGKTGNVDINIVGNYEVEINANDPSGNSSDILIKIKVVDKDVEIVEVPIVQPTNPSSPSTPNVPVKPVQPTNPSQPGEPTKPNDKPTTPQIIGVKESIQIKRGSSINDLQLKLASGVSTNNGEMVQIIYNAVNLTAIGTYQVHYRTDSGLHKICNVVVVE